MHGKPPPAMIAGGFADVQDYKSAVFRKNPVHPVHRCESKIYPCVTLSRLPAIRQKAFVSNKPAAPAQIKPSIGRPLSPPMELAILTGRWMGVMYSLVQSIPSAL